MVSDIRIDEVIEDKASQFTYRDFWIGNIHFTQPEKSLDEYKLTREVFIPIQDKFKFREGARNVKAFSDIEKLYNDYDATKVQDFYFYKNWSTIPTILNYTFNFNPVNHGVGTSALNGFYDRYHEFSNPLLTVPNIKIEKSIVEKRPGKRDKIIKTRIMSIDDYIKFIDSAYEYLDKKNNKHIFVPISLRFSLGEINRLLNHYIKKEHYYYWVDFEARPVYQPIIGILRHIHNTLRDLKFYDKSIFYYTNIKREIITNSKNDQSEASDVLSPLIGANIIGVNREPMIPYNKKTEQDSENQKEIEKDKIEKDKTNYKARLLDNSTYYYKRTDDPFLSQKLQYNNSNALSLEREFENQTNHFLTDYSMKDYLSKKKMLTTFQNGDLLKDLTSKQPITKNLAYYLS